jgi:hypothetical protein
MAPSHFNITALFDGIYNYLWGAVRVTTIKLSQPLSIAQLRCSIGTTLESVSEVVMAAFPGITSTAVALQNTKGQQQ